MELEERSSFTIEKYIRDIKKLIQFSADRNLDKTTVIEFKDYLLKQGYKESSVNSVLSSVNSYLDFMNKSDCKVKNIKLQKRIYSDSGKQLSQEEYVRLVKAAGEDKQIELVIQTICSTGIRISELKYFTLEAVKKEEVTINCKNKTREIIIPQQLCEKLLEYCKDKEISLGPVFVTKNGTPLDRSNIWKKMKKICCKAGVNPEKVFPHNLRKLFARTFYQNEKDIAVLADILGHSSIETTRIYIMTTGEEHRRKIEMLNLVV